MKSLATQFDNNRLSSAVATPTCSSCCCCCCCLATVITSSSLLGQRVSKEADELRKPNKTLLKIIGYLYIPIAGLLTAVSAFAVDKLFKTCATHLSSSTSSYTYQTCNNPGIASAAPLLIFFIVLLIWLMYKSVNIKPSLGRAILVTVLICLAFAAEFMGGAMMILTGIGGFIYLALVPVISGWISLLYRKYLNKKTAANADNSTNLSSPINSAEHYSASAPVPPLDKAQHSYPGNEMPQAEDNSKNNDF